MNMNNKLVKKTFIYTYMPNEGNKDKANEEYIRSQVYYILDEALKLREKNKNKEADDLLSNMEDWIKTNYKGNNKFYLEDIQNAKNLFKNEETFLKKGKAFAKSNIKQKIHKKIGANDMYKNCNMEYYCEKIDEKDLDISGDNGYNINDSYNNKNIDIDFFCNINNWYNKNMNDSLVREDDNYNNKNLDDYEIEENKNNCDNNYIDYNVNIENNY